MAKALSTCTDRAPGRPARAGARALVTAIAAAAACGVGACSSQATKHPALLGDCIPTDGAPCSVPSGGTGAGSQSGGGAQGGSSSGSVAGCGLADQHLQTSNVTCVPCVVGGSDAGPTGLTDCCQSDLDCTTNTCVPLIDCALGCSGSLDPTSCLTGCENAATAAAVGAYRDFANCVLQNCSPECPALPQLP